MALRGTVLNTVVSKHMPQDLYTKKYNQLDPTEKEACDKSLIERVMVMILFGDADSNQFSKL